MKWAHSQCGLSYVGARTNKYTPHELDHDCLVDECRRLFDAGGDISARLVQAAEELGPFGVFGQGCRGGGHRRVRARNDVLRDSRAIQSAPALDTCAYVRAHCFVRKFRATLSPRRTTMASVDHLRSADRSVNSQFHFHAES